MSRLLSNVILGNPSIDGATGHENKEQYLVSIGFQPIQSKKQWPALALLGSMARLFNMG